MERKIEIVWENQRGGQSSPFTAKGLLPTDFTPWSDKLGDFRPSKELIELPDNYQWNGEWSIDRTGDCSREGWRYSNAFKSTLWVAEKNNTAYVRQRKWVRGKKKVEGDVKQASSSKSDFSKRSSQIVSTNPDIKEIDILSIIQKCKIDREKFFVVRNLVQNKKRKDQVIEKADQILKTFEFEKDKILTLLLIRSEVDPKKLIELCAGNLKYYSDRRIFIEKK